MRLSRPIYEALPWVYLAGGVAALAAAWFMTARLWSNLLVLAGFAALVGGLVLLLRRRDYRDQQRRYGRDLDGQ